MYPQVSKTHNTSEPFPAGIEPTFKEDTWLNLVSLEKRTSSNILDKAGVPIMFRLYHGMRR